MSDLRKAAQAVIQTWDDPAGTTGVCRALDDLRAALATVPSDCPNSHQPKQKPVCDECGKSKVEGWALYCVDCMEPVFGQRKPLTDEEIQELSQQHKFDSRIVKFVRIIERAHGIGSKDEQCRYPGCVDTGPDGKCTRWLLAECEKSEDYGGKR